MKIKQKTTLLTFFAQQIAFLIGKCGLTCAFGAVYVVSSELFPTPIRSAGVGTCSTCGRLGAIVTPWVASLKVIDVFPFLMLFSYPPLILKKFILDFIIVSCLESELVRI